MPSLYSLLFQLLSLYSWLIIIWVILSWLQAYNKLPNNRPLHIVMAVLYKLTNPAFSLVRRFLPPKGGFDLSPLVVLIAILIIKALLGDLLL
jgi:YggT family protein